MNAMPDAPAHPPPRKIIHIDMDCFFASIEERDNPSLRGLPVAVGGSAQARGVIATANYVARRFGVHSAMASARALRLCPRLKLLPPRHAAYAAESCKVHAILAQYTPLVEPMSLDEAFLDVTAAPACRGSATWMAAEIRERIWHATGLTASAGVAPNKFLAKVASDWHKPNGQKVVLPHEVAAFVQQLPVAKLPGVGKITDARLASMGIRTCAQLQGLTAADLQTLFGSYGLQLFRLCRGEDDRPVETQFERKSVSVENTFPFDLESLQQCLDQAVPLWGDLAERLEAQPDLGAIRALFVKVKWSDFRSTTLERCGIKEPSVMAYRHLLLQALERRPLPVRLLGLGVRLHSAQGAPKQLELWPEQVMMGYRPDFLA